MSFYPVYRLARTGSCLPPLANTKNVIPTVLLVRLRSGIFVFPSASNTVLVKLSTRPAAPGQFPRNRKTPPFLPPLHRPQRRRDHNRRPSQPGRVKPSMGGRSGACSPRAPMGARSTAAFARQEIFRNSQEPTSSPRRSISCPYILVERSIVTFTSWRRSAWISRYFWTSSIIDLR